MIEIDSTKLKVGNIVVMRKGHPCGENKWKIVRYGADVKIECLGCNRVILMPRHKFIKNIKDLVE